MGFFVKIPQPDPNHWRRRGVMRLKARIGKANFTMLTALNLSAEIRRVVMVRAAALRDRKCTKVEIKTDL